MLKCEIIINRFFPFNFFHGDMNVACSCDIRHSGQWVIGYSFNTFRPRQNGRHFAHDIFKRILFNENIRISIKISLKFVPKDPINNILTLVQIMAWRRSGDTPLSESMLVSLPTHICVTRSQWGEVIMFIIRGTLRVDYTFYPVCLFVCHDVCPDDVT